MPSSDGNVKEIVVVPDEISNEIAKIPSYFRKISPMKDRITLVVMVFMLVYMVVTIGIVVLIVRSNFLSDANFILKIIVAGFSVVWSVMTNRLILGVFSGFLRPKLVNNDGNISLLVGGSSWWDYTDIKISFEIMGYELPKTSKRVKIVFFESSCWGKVDISLLGRWERNKDVVVSIPSDMVSAIVNDRSKIARISLSYMHQFTGIKIQQSLYITGNHIASSD